MTKIVLMLLASVLLAAAAQLTLKLGMTSQSVQLALGASDRSFARAVAAIMTSPMILSGLFLFAVSVVIWLLVLARLDLSTAYPCVALGVVITVASGHFILGETVSPTKLAGVTAVVIGVLLIGISGSSNNEPSMAGASEEGRVL